jgi:hypothetical protein
MKIKRARIEQMNTSTELELEREIHELKALISSYFETLALKERTLAERRRVRAEEESRAKREVCKSQAQSLKRISELYEEGVIERLERLFRLQLPQYNWANLRFVNYDVDWHDVSRTNFVCDGVDLILEYETSWSDGVEDSYRWVRRA